MLVCVYWSSVIVSFVDRIISLDMSLAVDSYHMGSQRRLEKSFNDLKRAQDALTKKVNVVR